MCFQKLPLDREKKKETTCKKFLNQLVSWLAGLKSVADKAAAVLSWLKITFTSNPRLEYSDSPTPTTARTFDVQSAKKILKVGDKEEAIRKRSIPNERLKTTFHIENPFTTFNIDVHEMSVKEIRNLVKVKSYADEKKLIDNIFQTEKYIFVKKNGQKIPFKEFVMITSFKFSIKRFFSEMGNIQISQEENSKLCLKAAQYITSLWIDSKNGSVKESDKKVLFEILQNIFPQKNIYDTIENPLGKILPSFETLWRVLFRLCYTLKFSEKKYIEMIKEFGKNPNTETYTEMKDDISVENIIKEILFLNPPTRTIYRLKDENNNNIGIDVLKMHEQCMGGKTHFFPERWSEKNDLPFFTFGYGGLSCPARKFAPIILGLMGATIFETFQEYEWDINAECFSSEAEINDRNKYPEFYLIKKDLSIG